MTDRAIVETTEGLQRLIEEQLGPNQVYVGPPIASQVGQRRASLFLFHLEPNKEMRNEPRFVPPPAASPPTARPEAIGALPLDLRYLITVFRTTGIGPGNDPNELQTLGQIVQALHTNPTLTGARLAGQVVRLMPEHYSMEELSRIWGLFPQGAQDYYRTSIVYLASPVFVEATTPEPDRPPVLGYRQESGIAATALRDREELAVL